MPIILIFYLKKSVIIKIDKVFEKNNKITLRLNY